MELLRRGARVSGSTPVVAALLLQAGCGAPQVSAVGTERPVQPVARDTTTAGDGTADGGAAPAGSGGVGGATDAGAGGAGASDGGWGPSTKVTVEGQAMGTHLSFAVYTQPDLPESAIRAAAADAIAEIRRLEALMTTWRPDSEVSRINAAAGKEPIAVSPETFEVIEKSLETSIASEGAFDITFESLHGLWKFDEDLDPNPPSPKLLKEKLKFVSYKHVRLDKAKRTVFITKKGTKIGLGGIAKGYAVDRAAAVLERAGAKSFFVQAGGDLFTRGTKPDGSAWLAGIRDPRAKGFTYFAMVPVSDHAFSTAGDYERSYVIDGKRYHHIIDPRTGEPARACRSVTIWAKSAFEADAVDDAVFILGPEKGIRWIDALDDVGAVVVDAKNNVWVSEKLRSKVVFTAVPTDGP